MCCSWEKIERCVGSRDDIFVQMHALLPQAWILCRHKSRRFHMLVQESLSPGLVNVHSTLRCSAYSFALSYRIRFFSIMADSYPEVQGGGSLILAYQVKNKKVVVIGGGEVRHSAHYETHCSCTNVDIDPKVLR